MHHHHSNTPDKQVRLASQMIAHSGTYGLVSQLSREHHISRQWLYALKEKGQKAIERVFCPEKQLKEQKVSIERAVLTLFTECHGSREGIQTSLRDILGIRVSTGKISAILHKAGKRAQELLDRQIPGGMRALALDEQYGSKRGEAYLNIVDVQSGQVLASVPPVGVDTDSWKLLLWQMQEKGLKWDIIVSDGGKAIHNAVHQVTPAQVHQRDVWHVLHECQKAQKRLNTSVSDLQKQIEIVKRQAKRVENGEKPRGKNPKTDVAAHVQVVERAKYVAESLRYLTAELQRLLSVVVLGQTPVQGILSPKLRQGELDALLELLSELATVAQGPGSGEIQKLFRHVQLALPHLVSFSEPMSALEQEVSQSLGQTALHLIAWAWQHRAVLGSNTDELACDFPPDWQPAVRKLFKAWNEAVRASSVVENWHSVLRPFLAVHRGLSADMLAILALWHNHRVATRGRHLGQSPIMRSGLENAPTDWLDLLVLPSPSLSPVPAQSETAPFKQNKESLVA
jgi:hypothetical protein